MRGPFLPLYGSGAIKMLVVSMPFQDHLFLTYLAGCVGATLLEYVTGVTMEALFKVRYWDYSNQKFNFQGQICLSSTLAWGGLTVLMTEVIHKPVESLTFMIPSEVLSTVTILLTGYIVSDFTLSFKAAMDLRDILVKMEKARAELVHLQKRLDVLIAVSASEWEERKQMRELKAEELRESLGERLNICKLMLQEKRAEFLKSAYRKSQILGNPGMISKKFKEVLEELKEAAKDKKK